MTQQIVKSINVKETAPAVYQLWANFENFPYFMKYVRNVRKTGPKTSHWEIAGPLGMTVEWNAEMTRLEEDKRIAWNSKDMDGTITTSGQVTFNNLPNNETEITVTMQYQPPGGKLGEAVAKLFSNPEERLMEDLRNFKTFVEGMRTPVG
ncbi:MAG: SRPBCC family protein [Chloroflexi bacterium]|nr:SRPBCC family protein [Chloroflexota bacterium]